MSLLKKNLSNIYYTRSVKLQRKTYSIQNKEMGTHDLQKL